MQAPSGSECFTSVGWEYGGTKGEAPAPGADRQSDLEPFTPPQDLPEHLRRELPATVKHNKVRECFDSVTYHRQPAV